MRHTTHQGLQAVGGLTKVLLLAQVDAGSSIGLSEPGRRPSNCLPLAVVISVLQTDIDFALLTRQKREKPRPRFLAKSDPHDEHGLVQSQK